MVIYYGVQMGVCHYKRRLAPVHGGDTVKQASSAQLPPSEAGAARAARFNTISARSLSHCKQQQ